MQNTFHSCSCCCVKDIATNGQSRRGFLGRTAAWIGGIFTLAVPTMVGVATFLNPWRQQSQSGAFLRLASLDVLPEDGTPRKVPVIADRADAWNSYPAEPIGAVFLRRTGKDVSALQVVCPHAGCSINYENNAQGGKFFCPCHAASFDLAGKITDATSPSPRDMDSLEVEIRNTNEVWVKFQTFGVGVKESKSRKASFLCERRSRRNYTAISFEYLGHIMFKTLWLVTIERVSAIGSAGWSNRPCGGSCWCKVLPCTVLFTFCIQAITGFFLWSLQPQRPDGLGKRLLPSVRSRRAIIRYLLSLFAIRFWRC